MSTAVRNSFTSDKIRENSAPDNNGERPRPMYESSVTDPESPEDKKSPTRNQPPASGDKKEDTAGSGLKGASGKNAKPPAAAELAHKGAVGGSLESIMRAGLSDPEEGLGGSLKSPLWVAFARSRSANERMRPTPPLKEWRTLKEDMAIPEVFQMWYDNQVGGRGFEIYEGSGGGGGQKYYRCAAYNSVVALLLR